ncbi:hypothetical protein [Paenibacillus odorifer]|uniref:hypothetical protein n=1 Tax=Paenibacillus odorifer TaxID=189426 RepID=UPI0020BFF704|nr:hypothetical protein [Paenibacillus odorifer]
MELKEVIERALTDKAFAEELKIKIDEIEGLASNSKQLTGLQSGKSNLFEPTTTTITTITTVTLAHLEGLASNPKQLTDLPGGISNLLSITTTVTTVTVTPTLNIENQTAVSQNKGPFTTLPTTIPISITLPGCAQSPNKNVLPTTTTLSILCQPTE